MQWGVILRSEHPEQGREIHLCIENAEWFIHRDFSPRDEENLRKKIRQKKKQRKSKTSFLRI